MHKKIAISIVVYKKYDDALEAVKSIEENTNPILDKIIYIIDNSCLEDNNITRVEFENCLLTYRDVVYINTKQNLGFGKGHNYTIDILDTDYFAIVNPDILITHGVFEKIVSFMETNDAGMVIPRIVDADGKLQDAYRRQLTVVDMFLRMFTKNICMRRKAYHSMKDKDYSTSFNVPFGQGSFLVIRTDLWKKLDGFDDRFFMYLEDADLCRRVNDESTLVYYPEAEVIHKWEKESHKNKKLFAIHLKSMFEYFNKWGWKIF